MKKPTIGDDTTFDVERHDTGGGHMAWCCRLCGQNYTTEKMAVECWNRCNGEDLDVFGEDAPTPNLRSSVNDIGEYTTQILHFKNDVKRTLHGVISSKIKEGEFTKLYLKDGRMIMINRKNLLLVEVFKE